MSGLPGSGKTTLGRGLGQVLDLPVFDKDEILEAAFGDGTPGSSTERSRLSRCADVTFRELALASSGAVLVSFWRRRELSTESGTPTDWLEGLPNVVEVYCVCSPSTAAARFVARTRHPGHGDATKARAHVAEQFALLHRVGPLGIGRIVEINTESAVDVEAIAAAVADRQS